jgi:NAD(P)H-hydrate epimerase
MSQVVVSQKQAREVDRRAIEEYGLAGVVLMENAGRGVVDVLEQLDIKGPVVVACGKGNNAGDGFVIARHLEIRGHQVQVALWAQPGELHGDAAANFAILQKTCVPIHVFGNCHNADRLAALLADADWVVDALLGTGAQGEPRAPLDAVIDQLNDCPARRLAVDLPSGLDCDTGQAAAHTIRATHTCTFLAVKPGFLQPGVRDFTGAVHVLDIGAPPKLIQEVLGRTE